MKERSSDKMNQNLDYASHVREHEIFPPFRPGKKSVKNYYSFFLTNIFCSKKKHLAFGGEGKTVVIFYTFFLCSK